MISPAARVAGIADDVVAQDPRDLQTGPLRPRPDL